MSSARIKRTGGQSGPSGNNPYNSLRSTDPPLNVPLIEDTLVDYLNAVFPDRLSAAQTQGLDRALGAREVVEHLIALHIEQNTKDK